MVSSEIIGQSAIRPNIVQLDDIDRILLRELVKDARIPNNALATRAGIAPSTCLARVRALRDAGVITGFHTAVDPNKLGLMTAALVALRIRPQARSRMVGIARELSKLPNVLSSFLMGGDRDIILHVVCTSPAELRDFVSDELSAHPDIANTQTDLVFEHIANPGS
ncbi:Lrp/AsnC family transcriptional regulator [Streptomyces sp. NPDC006510]|uniref:Lrp/AsnC family transcriptional regulator n=1 Tax=Streptomyces sp. NPDC006510 TaxID=3155600 RepID=UPI0033A4666C